MITFCSLHATFSLIAAKGEMEQTLGVWTMAIGVWSCCDNYSTVSKSWETKHLSEWPYRLGPLLAGYSYKARPCPVWTAAGGSLLPELSQHGFLRWHRLGRLASCDRPSSFHYTQSRVEQMTGMTRKKTRQQERQTTWGSLLHKLWQDRGWFRTVREEGMMTGGTHNCWRHIYWSTMRRTPYTPLCKTTNLLCFVVIQIILFLLISEVPPHATDYLPNFP